MTIPTFNLPFALCSAVMLGVFPLALTVGCTAQETDYQANDTSTYNNPQQYTSASAGRSSMGASPSFVQPVGDGFVRYTAPENAFTVEIPDGWQAYTQIDRSGGFGGIPWNIYASADNQIIVRTPDHPAVTYLSPNPQMGMYEGGTAGYNRTPVRHYVPGMYYAAEHAQRLAHVLNCTDGRFIDARERPDLVQRAFRFAPPGAASQFTQATHGQVTVRCRQKGQARVIVAHASTLGMRSNGGWYVNTAHMTAPAAEAEKALRILEHMSQTHTPNRAWVQQEAAVGQRKYAENERLRAQQGRQWAATRPKPTWSPSAPGSSTYSGAASDKAHQSFINSIRGTQDLTDRYGDTIYGVESTFNYHWQDGQGNIVGTDLNDNPNALEYERMGTPPRR